MLFYYLADQCRCDGPGCKNAESRHGWTDMQMWWTEMQMWWTEMQMWRTEVRVW